MISRDGFAIPFFVIYGLNLKGFGHLAYLTLYFLKLISISQTKPPSIMKKHLTIIIFALLSTSIAAQSPIGAWEAITTAENGDKLRNVVILVEGYQVLSVFNATTEKFVHTNGGKWSLNGNTMTEIVEFHSDDPEFVGKEVSFEIAVTDTTLHIVGGNMILHRIDNGTPGDLEGAWLMSGRVRNGEMQSRDTNRPRKTMKILSGTQFQWIAYNTETKQFMGTGGGTYTTENGKYTENIDFFSRDNNRVGASLEFDFELKEGDWHHKGLSSKGQPIYEIWSLR